MISKQYLINNLYDTFVRFKIAKKLEYSHSYTFFGSSSSLSIYCPSVIYVDGTKVGTTSGAQAFSVSGLTYGIHFVQVRPIK